MRTTSNYIKVSSEAREKLARAFEVEEKTVYLALTGRRDSDKAKKIRYTAVKEYGGIPMVHCPECETMHDITEDGRQIMRQRFNNGATLRIDKNTGETWITNHHGETVMHKQCITIPQLTEIQVMAENM